MIIELLKGEEVYTVIETATPDLELETYQQMIPELTGWREKVLSYDELHERVRQKREEAYKQLVDPLTAQIQRLRDMEPRSLEILELEKRRATAVEAIHLQNPYPEVKDV